MGQKREREGEKRGYSRLPAETLQYFEEVAGRLKELEDDEERQLLADNALGEADSAVATDAACSRVVEALLPHASTAVLATFAKAVVEGENLGAMCTRCGARLAAAACRRRCQRHTCVAHARVTCARRLDRRAQEGRDKY